MPVYGGYSPETVFIQLSSAENAVFHCCTPHRSQPETAGALRLPPNDLHPPEYHEDVLAMPGDSDLYSHGAIVNLAASWVGLVVQLVEDGENVYR